MIVPKHKRHYFPDDLPYCGGRIRVFEYADMYGFQIFANDELLCESAPCYHHQDAAGRGATAWVDRFPSAFKMKMIVDFKKVEARIKNERKPWRAGRAKRELESGPVDTGPCE